MVSAQYSLALPLTQLGPYLSLSPTVPTVWETAAVAWLPCLSESKFNLGGWGAWSTQKYIPSLWCQP